MSSKSHLERRVRRRLLIEPLESRALMAVVSSSTSVAGLVGNSQINPDSAAALSAVLQQQITDAFVRVSDLSQYTPLEIDSASQWVLHATSDANATAVTNALGNGRVSRTTLIDNTLIYTLPAGVDRQQVGKTLRSLPGVDYVYPLVPSQQSRRFQPNDPLYAQQWHLENSGQTGGTTGADANVETAWDTVRGTGVVIGIVDDGLQYTHPDLAAKYLANLSIDVNFGDNDPMPGAGDFHGTAVGGVAAAATDNNLGVAGAAPGASLAGIRLISAPTTDAQEAGALTHQNQQIDIYNNSWGPADGGYAFLSAPGPLTVAALQASALQGRGGLGTLQVWAGGNGGDANDNSNYDGYANSLYTFAVAAIDHNGRQSYYSEPGANVFISAPSNSTAAAPGIVTTDILGANGYNDVAGSGDFDPLPDLDYTSTFGGTSSAAPLVAGVLALVLEANPNLTWRDVKHILVQSARRNDTTDAGWTVNGAGHDINPKYGFGAIDASAAVALAQNWTLVAPLSAIAPTSVTVGQAIPDNNTPVTATIPITQDLTVEEVEITVSITHARPADLTVVLTSPDGTQSVLQQTQTLPLGAAPGSLQTWSYSSVRSWGEQARGNWTVTVTDARTGSAGTFNAVRLNLLGTAGQTPGARVEGTVFNDTNQNGVQDVGELGIPNATVFVDTNNSGTLDVGEVSRLTGLNGAYVITGLTPGAYFLDVVVPPLATQTLPASGAAYNIVVVANQSLLNQNFGFVLPPSANGPFILSNQPGDGSIAVGVDGFGSFGDAPGPDQTDSIYDPPGAIGPGQTTYASGVAIGFGGPRQFLTSGTFETTSNLTNPLVTGNSTAGTSQFVIGNIQFTLTQTIVPLTNAAGAQIGTQLRQSYSMTNIGSSAVSFDMVRYFDGDLLFDGSLFDGGGRLVVNGTEILFETDSATGGSDDATFIGITGTGGSIPATGRYEIDLYSGLQARIAAGLPLDMIITNDGADADQFVDAGQGDDLTLGLTNIFILQPGQTDVYETSTLFGSGRPDEIIPTPPPPPPPVYLGGVVTNDLNGNGVYDPGEPGIPGAIVYLDMDNDSKIGLGEPAQVTNAAGQYGFNVRAGNYVVRQGQLPGWAVTAPAAGFYSVTAASGDQITDHFFGNFAAVDYGDLPSPFPTLAGQGGASHSTLPGMYLGSTVDGEADGKPSLKADGDDQTSVDDDDGVVFVTPLVAGQTASVDVTVHNGGRASGVFQGWIDFNGDNDWNDAGERVFTDVRVVEGVNRLTFTVPSYALPGNGYARFRYGYGTNMSYTGNVMGGEVEDYVAKIVGPKPVAKPDTFTVQKNSTNNVFDVLFNDSASTLSSLIAIIGTTIGSLGGTVSIDSTNQTLKYTQKANTLGVETFNYTISDFKGGISTATVTVTIEQAAVPPTAVDDTFRVLANSASNTINIYGNDRLGSSLLSLLLVPNTTTGGSISMLQPGNVVQYTPRPGFVGVDQFQYVVRDMSGLQSTATVTMHVGDGSTNDQAKLELRVTDADGNVITEVALGQTFQVRAYVTDLRTAITNPGVQAAYLDLLYASNLATPVAAANFTGVDITFAPDFNLVRSGSATTPGIINEVGATMSTFPTGAGPTELFRMTFTAQALGTARFTADPADEAILHDVLLGSPLQTVPVDKITYGLANVSIVTTPTVRFQNQHNVNDVDGDGRIAPLDVLLVINELNARGAMSVAGRVQSSSQPRYWDVNGDNKVNTLDAALLLTYLNSGGHSEAAADAPVVPQQDSPLAASETETEEALLPDWLDEQFEEPLSAGTPSGSFAQPTAAVVLPPFLLAAISQGDYTAAGASDDEELEDLFDVLALDVDAIWQMS